jgi:RNA-binding protein PNO1
MPAPTAILAPDHEIPQDPSPSLSLEDEGTDFVLDPTVPAPQDGEEPSSLNTRTEQESTEQMDVDGAPRFAPAADKSPVHRVESRKIPIPPHRFTPVCLLQLLQLCLGSPPCTLLTSC